MGDPDAEGLLSVFPYLKQLGVSDKHLIYKFDYNGARFIFLWTGKYDEHSPTAWGATRPTYEEQMKQLAQWLDEAKAAGIRKVFISFPQPGLLPLRYAAPSPKLRIPTSFLRPTPRIWTSWSSTATCTRPKSTRWMA